MELGNMVNGHPNIDNKFEIDRQEGFEQQIIRLTKAIASIDESGVIRNGSLASEGTMYGLHYDNDIFMMMPYYWGDCTCGWDELEYRTWDLKHKSGCYQNEYKRIGETIDMFKQYKKYEKAIVKAMDTYGIKYDPKNPMYGCAMHCTCDYNQRYDEIIKQCVSEFGQEGHKNDCKLVLPNFLYKPTGLQITVYKYFFRDSYCNIDINLPMFTEIIDKCIESLKIKGE